MLQNPQDFMPDKMMDKEVIGKMSWKILLIVGVLIFLTLFGIKKYLQDNPKEEFENIRETQIYCE